MSYMLAHLKNGWQVDQAILSEEDRVVVIRFGHDWDPTCMKMDEVLYSIAEKVRCQSINRSTGHSFLLLGRSKTLPSSIWSTWPKCRTSTKCTNCTTRARSCFSSATNTSWSTWAPETTTKSTGRWKTSRKWSTFLKRCTEERERDAVWSSRPKIILPNIDTRKLIVSKHTSHRHPPTHPFILGCPFSFINSCLPEKSSSFFWGLRNISSKLCSKFDFKMRKKLIRFKWVHKGM